MAKRGFPRGMGGMGGNIGNLMKQAQKMQQEMIKAQEELAEKTVEATVGGGAVKVIATGAKEIKEIIIAQEAVDPDDVTLASIAKAGCEIESYGSPVLPGAVFLVAYKDNIPVIGLPACGMYHKATVFDILFPRFLAGERVTRKDIVELAHGGLCMECNECHYPICPFGKA